MNKAAEQNFDSIKTELDKAVSDGAVHASVVITYPGGEQIVMTSTMKGRVNYCLQDQQAA